MGADATSIPQPLFPGGSNTWKPPPKVDDGLRGQLVSHRLILSFLATQGFMMMSQGVMTVPRDVRHWPMSPARVFAAAFSVVRPGTLRALLFSISAIGISSKWSGLAARSCSTAGLNMWLMMLRSETNAPPADRKTRLNLWLNMKSRAFLNGVIP